MTLTDEIQSYFGTKNLYEVLDIDNNATKDQIKKAYRKASLKIHPDRVGEAEKDEATKKFQVLAQVHFVLDDESRKSLYDEHGIISNEDGLDSGADWEEYWRLLFPKITEKDIQKFMDSYVGSKEEEEDLIKMYNKFEGDLDKISQSMISYDEDTTFDMLKRLMGEGKITDFEKFSLEPSAKKNKRKKRAEKEAKQAEKLRKELESKAGKDISKESDLTALIQRRSQGNFNSMIANLEAKYGGGKSTKKAAPKRKR